MDAPVYADRACIVQYHGRDQVLGSSAVDRRHIFGGLAFLPVESYACMLQGPGDAAYQRYRAAFVFTLCRSRGFGFVDLSCLSRPTCTSAFSQFRAEAYHLLCLTKGNIVSAVAAGLRSLRHEGCASGNIRVSTFDRFLSRLRMSGTL